MYVLTSTCLQKIVFFVPDSKDWCKWLITNAGAMLKVLRCANTCHSTSNSTRNEIFLINFLICTSYDYMLMQKTI